MRAQVGEHIKASSGGFAGGFDRPAGGRPGGNIEPRDARRRTPGRRPGTCAGNSRDGRHVAARRPSAAFRGSTWRPCPPWRVTAETTRAERNSVLVRDWFRRHREDSRPGRTHAATIPISDSNRSNPAFADSHLIARNPLPISHLCRFQFRDSNSNLLFQALIPISDSNSNVLKDIGIGNGRARSVTLERCFHRPPPSRHDHAVWPARRSGWTAACRSLRTRCASP